MIFDIFLQSFCAGTVNFYSATGSGKFHNFGLFSEIFGAGHGEKFKLFCLSLCLLHMKLLIFSDSDSYHFEIGIFTPINLVRKSWSPNEELTLVCLSNF